VITVAERVAERIVLGPEDVVECPNDGLAFRPFFTGGACPLCKWQSPTAIAEPWTHRADWLWIAFACMVAVSILMAVIVFVAL
jgi:hypothetical protein